MDQGGESGARVAPAPLTLLCLALGAAAYRPLLAIPEGPVALAFERWLFEPSHVEPAIVVLGAAWLVWCRRDAWFRAVAVSEPAPGLGGACFALAAALHAWATLTAAPFLLVPSLGLALAGWASLRAGLSGVRALALPLGFLVFALPVPAPLLNVLVWEQQETVGRITVELLGLAGIPATASGILFEHPERRFIVIETCSGLRFAEVFAALAVLLRGRAAPGMARTLLAGLGGAAIGLGMNQLRVLWIAVGEGSLAVGEAHALQGVAALALGLPLLVLFTRGLARPPAGRLERGVGDAAPWQALAGLLALLASVSFVLDPVPLPRAVPYDLARIPAARGGWQSELLATDFQLLGSVRFDEVLRRAYRNAAGESVELFVGTALRGDPHRSPFSRSTELPSSGWVVFERFPVRAENRQVTALVLTGAAERALAHTWRVGDRGLAVETLRSALALDRSPFAEPRRRAVVRVATNLRDASEAELTRAAERLNAFVAVFAGTLPERD